MIEYNDRTDDAPIKRSTPSLDASDVRSFLLLNPDFVLHDAELLAQMMPARDDGESVVDMQSFVITKLQRQVRTLRDIQTDLIEASSLNSLAREQVHAAALAMLDAQSFDALVEYITLPDGLAATLGLASATICMEATGRVSRADTIGIRLLERGGVARKLAGTCRSSLIHSFWLLAASIISRSIPFRSGAMRHPLGKPSMEGVASSWPNWIGVLINPR